MPRLVAGPPSHAAPSTYKLAPSEAFIPESVTATFNGAGAGGAFLPTLSIYSQDGKLIARSPASSVAAGSSAEVTFAPLLRAATSAAAGTDVPIAVWTGLTPSTITPGGGGFQYIDGDFLETNHTDVFALGPSVDVGTNGLTKVLKIMQAGTYSIWAFALFETPFGMPAEPLASWMYCDPFSFNYPADEIAPLTWGAPGVQGAPLPAPSPVNRWQPWDSDHISYPASKLPPHQPAFQEFVPQLYNAGTQDMKCSTWLLCVRWSDLTSPII